MKKGIKIFCLILLVLLSNAGYADEECDAALAEGKREYNNGDYQRAKAFFNNVIEWCSASYGNAGEWKRKCDDAMSSNLSLSKTSLNFNSSGGSQSINVSANKNYSISSVSNSAFNVSRSGTTITVSCSSNPYTTSRKASFTVSCGSKSIVVSLYQSPQQEEARLSVSKTSISAPYSGITEYITVECNREWEIQYSSGEMYSASKSGNQVKVEINANSSTQSRNDYFNVRTLDQSKSVKISLKQDAKSTSAALSVSQTEIYAPSSGKTVYITVSSDRAWEIEYSSGTMYSASKQGSQVQVVINKNSGASRSDFFNVKTVDGSKVVKIKLSQSGSGGNSNNSGYKHTSSYRSSAYKDFRDANGIFEMYWLGFKGCLGSGLELPMYAFSMRIGPIRINPCEFSFGFSYGGDILLAYQASMDFYIPWNDSWAVYFGAGPSINLLYSSKGSYYDKSSLPIWFKVEAGVHFHWGALCSSEFFFRYDGIYSIGTSFNLGTGF